MTKWEYKFVTSEGSSIMDDGRYVSGNPWLVTFFQTLGMVGWELVTVTDCGSTDNGHVYRYIFKRPIENEE